MLDFIKTNSLVLAPNNIKKQILKEMSLNGKLLNLKFMTLEEFKDNYFGKPKRESLYFLMKKYNLDYDVALEYLSNVFYDYDFIKPFYDDLVNNDLIEYNSLFKDSLDNIVVYYEVIEPYIKDIFDMYNVTYVNFENGNYIPKVYSFDSQTNEIVYVASDIISKLDNINININDICLVNVNDDYNDEIKRIFKWFNIPINIGDKKSIYSTIECQNFMKVFKETRDVSLALEGLVKNDIYNKIIDILNEYCFDSFDDIKISIIEKELRKSYIKNVRLDNAVNVVNINEMDKEKYYYLIGFNQGSIPRIYHDDELIKDKDRKGLGLFTSNERFLLEKESIKRSILNTKNLVITYKLKDYYNTYFPSALIDEMGFDVIENPNINLVYSNLYNKLYLSSLLDRYLKYNEVSSDVGALLNTYDDFSYMDYDNSFKGINRNCLYDYLGGKLNLSYSSVNNYFHCGFRYYINNILKLDPYEETFSIFLGDLFHQCLSKMYEKDFDLRKEYDEFLKDKNLSSKDKFFVNKLYKELEFIVETIKKHDFLSSFDKVSTEKYVGIDKEGKLKIKFLGFVDKIKYKLEGDRVLCAVIDYKTGSIATSLDNINYGFNLQLPIYVYLADSSFDKKVEVVGFYLHKILPPKKMDDDGDASNLMLEGYSINDEELLKKFDVSYQNSEVIKGLRTSSNGFYSNSKVLSEDDIAKIRNIVDERINKAISKIENVDFSINPKRINDKLVGCEFCKYKDLCFRKEEDIVNLKNMKIEDILNEGDYID